MKEIPTYYATIESDTEDLVVEAISLVAKPAIKVGFVALSESETSKQVSIQLAEQMLYGAVLIPEQLIYRNNDLGEHNIVFSKSEIKKISQKVLRPNTVLKINLEHSEKELSGTVVESWLVVNGEMDKMKALGLSETLPEGTWCLGIHLEDTTEWTELVESGKVRGFSLEGMFRQNLKTTLSELDMDYNKIIDGVTEKIQRMLSLNQKTPGVNRVQMSAGQSRTVITPETAVLKDPKSREFWGGHKWGGKVVVSTTETGKLFALCASEGVAFEVPAGSYKLNTGDTLTYEAGVASVESPAKLAVTATHTLEDGTGIYLDPTTGEVYKVDGDMIGDAVADGTYPLQDGAILTVVNGIGTTDGAEAADEAADAMDNMADGKMIDMLSKMADLITALNTRLDDLQLSQKKTETMMNAHHKALSEIPGSKLIPVKMNGIAPQDAAGNVQLSDKQKGDFAAMQIVSEKNALLYGKY